MFAKLITFITFSPLLPIYVEVNNWCYIVPQESLQKLSVGCSNLHITTPYQIYTNTIIPHSNNSNKNIVITMFIATDSGAVFQQHGKGTNLSCGLCNFPYQLLKRKKFCVMAVFYTIKAFL